MLQCIHMFIIVSQIEQTLINILLSFIYVFPLMAVWLGLREHIENIGSISKLTAKNNNLFDEKNNIENLTFIRFLTNLPVELDCLHLWELFKGRVFYVQLF